MRTTCSTVICLSRIIRSLSSDAPTKAVPMRESLSSLTRLITAIRKPVQTLIEATICCRTSSRPNAARRILPNRISSLICCVWADSAPLGIFRMCDCNVGSSSAAGMVGIPVRSRSHCARSVGERNRTRKGTDQFCCLRSDMIFLLPAVGVQLSPSILLSIAHGLHLYKISRRNGVQTLIFRDSHFRSHSHCLSHSCSHSHCHFHFRNYSRSLCHSHVHSRFRSHYV